MRRFACVGWALCGHNAAPEASHVDIAADSESQHDVAAVSGSPPEAIAGPMVAGQNGRELTSSVGGEWSAVEDSSDEPPRRAGCSIPRAEKQAVGMMCKQLLDCGRLLWLRQHGFEVRRVKPCPVVVDFLFVRPGPDLCLIWQAKMMQYVPADVSGENRLLLSRIK